MDPINAASFGKLIRSIFVGLKTRRLGTRGNSKYHYYGVKVSDLSPLKNRAELQCEEWPTPNIEKKTRKRTMKTEPEYMLNFDASTMGEHIRISEFSDQSKAFVACYKLHMKEVTEAILAKQFGRVEVLVQGFWRVYHGDARHPSQLSAEEISSILDEEAVVMALRRVERRFCQSLVHCLIPDPMQSMSNEYQQTLLAFIDKYTEWTRISVSGTPTRFQVMRAESTFYLGVVIDDRMNICEQLGRALRELRPPTSLQRLSESFESINRNLISASIGWALQDDPSFVTNMDANISSLLRNGQTLGQCVRSLLGYGFAYADRSRDSIEQYQQACRNVVHNWNLYSAYVLRCFFVRSIENYTFFIALLNGMGNYLTQEMSFKTELATPLMEPGDVGLIRKGKDCEPANTSTYNDGRQLYSSKTTKPEQLSDRRL